MHRRTAVPAATLTIVLAASLAGCSDDGTKAPSSTAVSKASTSASASASAESVARLIQTGITQAQGNDLASATTTFGNALVLDPGNKFALYNLGLIAQTRGQKAAAIRYYQQAQATDPSYTPAMYNEAILMEDDDLRGAVGLYTKIVGINPRASTAYLRLGFAYAALGDQTQAKAARAKALALDPELSTVPAPKRG